MKHTLSMHQFNKDLGTHSTRKFYTILALAPCTTLVGVWIKLEKILSDQVM